MPSHFVATPNGWFDPACVVELAPGETVTHDGSVMRPDGSISRAARQCPSPRFDALGRIIADASPNAAA